MNDKAFHADFSRQQIPRSVADAAQIAAMGANLVLTGHLTRLLCCSVNPVTCVTRERTKHRADGALHGRVGLGSGLGDRLQVRLAHLDRQKANAILAPLTMEPHATRPGGGRSLSDSGSGGPDGWQAVQSGMRLHHVTIRCTPPLPPT